MRTLTCFIVDDEPLIVQRLASLWDKPEFAAGGYKLIGKACSGQEGLELALELKPDIVITDIVMPHMTGIDLITALKPRLKETVFVILSAYKDFDYAKQAMALNVTEYLVKVPLNERDLLRALNNARLTIEANSEQGSKLSRIEQSMREHSYRLRKQVMAELLEAGGASITLPGSVIASVMERNREALMIRFEPKTYCCMHLRIDAFDAFQGRYDVTDQKRMRYAVINIAEETMQAFGHGFMFELTGGGGGRFAAFLSWKQVNSAQRLEEQCYAFGTELVRNVNQYLKLQVSAGFSRSYTGWERLGLASRDAAGALQDAFYKEARAVVTPARRLVYREEALTRFREMLDDLVLHAVSDKPLTFGWGELQALLERKETEPAKLCEAAEEFGLTLRKHRLLVVADTGVNWGDNLSSFVRKLGQIWSEALRLKAATRDGLLERDELKKAKKYIADHLAEKVALGDVAHHVGLNMTYFSEMFKKECGESFTDYVNRMRIEKAMEMMRTRRYNNQELSLAVGIANERYFCTLFKKYAGATPQKFMTMKR
ncbi:hypothetical protein SY83_03410 [Paenibacillus swuensis]|uniref:AraC family transcriptional regulator n=1 Tax=Paenibacillus swuensis TaxID=1178515 RepID=A0A172TEP4_9BACL|nr:response regulator [Paenibacillus swuensis]ANE45518.1 hypothetical protein SY83_03410 [Paenibacillus swuensis]